MRDVFILEHPVGYIEDTEDTDYWVKLVKVKVELLRVNLTRDEGWPGRGEGLMNEEINEEIDKIEKRKKERKARRKKEKKNERLEDRNKE